MPKSKPDQVIVHRLELQEHEREALDMVAASAVVRNVGEGVGAVLKPIASLSLASLGAILGALTVTEVTKEGGIWDKLVGLLWGGSIIDKSSAEQRAAAKEERNRKINLFVKSIEDKVSGLQPPL
jgi:hypothetical protein